ncbi:MAG: hypothetical protein WCQ32_01315 [bacterium]
MDKIPPTKQELLQKISTEYYALKQKHFIKGKLGILFDRVIENNFNTYGHLYGCKTKADFKRFYNEIKKEQKDASKQKEEFSAQKTEVVHDTLLEQVLELGLNMDTYF